MTNLNKTHLIVFIAGIVLGLLCGFFSGKAIYQPTFDEKIARDTVYVRDTVPDYHPAPADSATIRYVTRFLPVVKRDTVDHFLTVTKMVLDTVEVEIPITSKHYSTEQYDAYVSGYEPSLDSIFVYREKEIITETITRTVKESKHFFLNAGAGCEYLPNTGEVKPFAELGLRFKKGRFGIGAYGGYSHDVKDNKTAPHARVKMTFDIISF